jgi:hypothetical protein
MLAGLNQNRHILQLVHIGLVSVPNIFKSTLQLASHPTVLNNTYSCLNGSYSYDSSTTLEVKSGKQRNDESGGC